jgi:hypothetical protein
MPFDDRPRRERLPAEGICDFLVGQLQPVAIDAAEQVPGEVQILPFSRGSVQLDHRQLKLRMPREHRPLVGTEVVHQVVGHPDTAVEETPVPGGPVVGDARLEQVAQAILLVRSHELREALRLPLLDPVRIQIPGGLLRGQHVIDQPVHRRAELGIVLSLQDEADGFHPLVQVGVGVEGTAPRHLLSAGQPAEVVHDAVGLEQLQQRRDAALDVGTAACRPEAVAHAHGTDRHVPQPCVR